MATIRLSDASGEVIEWGTGAVLQLQFDEANQGRIVADITEGEAHTILEVLQELGVPLDGPRQVTPAPRGPNREPRSLSQIRERHPECVQVLDYRRRVRNEAAVLSGVLC